MRQSESSSDTSSEDDTSGDSSDEASPEHRPQRLARADLDTTPARKPRADMNEPPLPPPKRRRVSHLPTGDAPEQPEKYMDFSVTARGPTQAHQPAHGRQSYFACVRYHPSQAPAESSGGWSYMFPCHARKAVAAINHCQGPRLTEICPSQPV